MEATQLSGVGVVMAAGLIMGSFAWPVKVMRKFQFEHWFFVAMLVGLVIIPWGATLLFCSRPFEAYASVNRWVLIRSNLYSLCWGIANILGGICIARIGIALTGAILAGVGVSAMVTMPMVIKGSGLFKNAPDIGSPAGLVVMAGVAMAIAGVVLVAAAGFARDRALEKDEKKSGGFLGGLIMAAAAGLLSSGIALAFVYGQGPIAAAMKARGASDIPAGFSVWAVGLAAGATINVLFPAYLMTRNRSWGVLASSPRELLLSAIPGLHICTAVVAAGQGMLLLGALGASVGSGIQQASQIMGGQIAGFLGGEWKGVYGRPRRLMYTAIAVLLAAAGVMALGNGLAG